MVPITAALTRRAKTRHFPSKAAGSAPTEAYPQGTSQGDAGPRTKLGAFFSILRA
jgi:hypothetical protein